MTTPSASGFTEGAYAHLPKPAEPRLTVDTITSDQLDALQDRADRAEGLLRRYVSLADVTHKYRAMGGHDSLGANLTCAGCALRDEIRAALDEPKEPTT